MADKNELVKLFLTRLRNVCKEELFSYKLELLLNKEDIDNNYVRINIEDDKTTLTALIFDKTNCNELTLLITDSQVE